MEHLPLKARIGPPAGQERQRYSVEDGEREGGEISDTERSRERNYQGRDRYRDRERERDDAYSSSRAPYERERRYWDRDREGGRDRDYGRRDDREWTRDTGRGRHYRDSRGGWKDDRDRDRDRYDDRDDRDRGSRRSVYERPRDRDDYARDDRRYGDLYVGKTELGSSYRSGSDGQYRPHPRRSPEPPPFRDERRRSTSRSRGDGTSRNVRRRDDSVESRGSTARRGMDNRDRYGYANRKRERSRSPVEHDNRAQRRRRTDSPILSQVSSRRRSPSPMSRRREEKRPERRHYSPHSGSDTRSVQDPTAYRRSLPSPTYRQVTPPRPEPQIVEPRPAKPPANAKATLSIATPPSQNPASTSVVAGERSLFPGAERRSSTATPTQAENAPVRSPTKQSEIPPNTPSGPRSATAQPPPARLPKIPEYRGHLGHRYEQLDRFSESRLQLYSNYARANYELYRAKIDTEITATELRSAEQRRILAEQQKQRALET